MGVAQLVGCTPYELGARIQTSPLAPVLKESDGFLLFFFDAILHFFKKSVAMKVGIARFFLCLNFMACRRV